MNYGKIEKFINIEEGEFKNNKLSGFGRRMNSNGFYTIGFMNEDLLHGYAMAIKPDGTTEEGLWEDGYYKKQDITKYNKETDLIA